MLAGGREASRVWILFPVAAAAAAFGQGYIHKMLVFNLAPLIVSAGGGLSGV